MGNEISRLASLARNDRSEIPDQVGNDGCGREILRFAQNDRCFMTGNGTRQAIP